MEGALGGDLELASKTLQVEHKLFYFDLKENPRGRYLKISEKTSGSRSTIIVPAPGISDFVDLFKYYVAEDDPEGFDSSELKLDTKAFFFDVGENQRGRFLKVSETSVTRGRSTIIVPSGNAAGEGWAAFCDILVEIDEAQHLIQPANSLQVKEPSLPSEHLLVQAVSTLLPSRDTQEKVSGGPVPDASMILASSSGDAGGTVVSRVLRTEQKKFFFDLGSNARGQYLKISEVTGADRSAIILPASALEQFYETLGQFLETVRTERTAGPGATMRTVAPQRKWNDM